MILLSAIVPHSPLLVPTIGKEHTEKLAQTARAFAELEQALYLAQPETLVIISPHATMYPDAMSGNASPSLTGTLKAFGDHGTRVPAKPDVMLLDHIHRAMRMENVPFTLTSEEELDYGFTIPLLFLAAHLPHVRVVPLATSLLDARMHYEFGRQLKRVLHAEQTRVAVIASADLSHHANQFSPEGVTPEGQQFDTIIREKSVARDAAGLLALEPALLEKAGQCGYRPIIVLLGALENIAATGKELCYEAPFGVGAMILRYDLA